MKGNEGCHLAQRSRDAGGMIWCKTVTGWSSGTDPGGRIAISPFSDGSALARGVPTGEIQ